MRRVMLASEAETRTFGHRLARQLAPGDAVFLEGDLGAGKTTLARAIIETLTGVTDATSPTFTLVQIYDLANGAQLWHADLYRLEHPDEIEELGLYDAFEEAITLVEWPERMGRWRPRNRIDIALTQPDNGAGTQRMASLTGHGLWEEKIKDDRA